MARSVDEINDYIVTALVSNFAAIGITINPTLWSKRNLIRALCYTVAIAQALMEQLQDIFMSNIEAVVATAAAASPKWVQAKMFEFQYSATDPQVIALINTVPVYPTVDPTLQIITACSVTSDISNVVAVKVAKGNPFVALSSPEKASAQGYINTIGVAGIQYEVISLNPDNLYIAADIYYQGQYASVIQANVIAVINQFLQDHSVNNFDGKLKMSDLEETIRDIAGVNDVVLKNVRGRADSDAFAAGIDLILGTAVIQRQWSTIAGYIISETTAGKTLADSLNFIVE
jgi:hypothetical protein